MSMPESNSFEPQDTKFSRRTFLKAVAGAAAGAAFAGPSAVEQLLKPQEAQAKLDGGTPIERDPLLEGMNPSTVSANETFRTNRGLEVVLNTQIQTDIEVQNRFDKAFLEVCNVMKTNEALLSNGEFTPFIANGNIPVGGDLGEFGLLVKNSQEFPITTMFYPEGATTSAEGAWGTFDAKKGLKLNFVDEPGLFDFSADMNGQIYGMTPRLTEEKGLQLDIFRANTSPPPELQDRASLIDVAHTKIANVAMQMMTLTYGMKEVYGANYVTAGNLPKLLFESPGSVNDTIGTLMSNKTPEIGNFFNPRLANRSCLLQAKVLGK